MENPVILFVNLKRKIKLKRKQSQTKAYHQRMETLPDEFKKEVRADLDKK